VFSVKSLSCKDFILIIRLNQCLSLLPDEKYQFSVVGIDQSDNRIDIDFDLFPVQWHSSRGGSINASGIFKGGYSKREVNVTATVCGCSTVAKVILRSTLKNLVINPKSVSLKPDQSQQFTVKGFDQYGLAFDVRNITWEATGGIITQSGFFTANHNTKGDFSVTAIASDYLLLPETYRKIFYALGLSGYLGSFLLSFNEDFVNQLIARILKSILIENNTGSQSKILDDDSSNIINGGLEKSGEIFDLSDDSFLLWTSAKIERLIVRFLEKSGDLCLKLSCANIIVSAKIEIVGVPRSLRVYPSTRQVSEGEKFELTVEILDQYQSDYLTIELRNTGLYEWQKLGQLEAIGGKFNENGILILNDSSSEIKEVEVILNISIEISEGVTVEDFTKIKAKKLLALGPVIQESEENINELTEEDNNLDDNSDDKNSNDKNLDDNNDTYFPVLHSIKIEPSYIKIKVCKNCQFTVYSFDKFEEKIKIDEHIQWETDCGSIIPNGEFSNQANLLIDQDLFNNTKKITITAYVNGCSAKATIFVENSEKKYLNRFEFTKLVAKRAKEQYINHSQNSQQIDRAIYELKSEFETDIDLSEYD
jgi:hypothetical protein